MTMDRKTPGDFRDRIIVDPKVLVGKPIVKGTRIPVSLILNLVGHGATFDEIANDYPSLAVEDIRAAILYAGARLDHEEVFSFAAPQ